MAEKNPFKSQFVFFISCKKNHPICENSPPKNKNSVGDRILAVGFMVPSWQY
jgi:hypothetical protein